ncbi:UNVERIFIED_CONTAM: hypothetical protein K2H54_019522 [Gekko kuhli]
MWRFPSVTMPSSHLSSIDLSSMNRASPFKGREENRKARKGMKQRWVTQDALGRCELVCPQCERNNSLIAPKYRARKQGVFKSLGERLAGVEGDAEHPACSYVQD